MAKKKAGGMKGSMAGKGDGKPMSGTKAAGKGPTKGMGGKKGGKGRMAC